MDALEADQRSALEALGTAVRYPAEHTVFWEGQPSYSIALNTLRWLNYKPEEIKDLVRKRAEQRMKDQALAILDKYWRIYGI